MLSFLTLKLGVSASDGTGIRISTLFAVDLLLNCDFALIRYSTLLCVWGSTFDSIIISGLTLVFNRYDISSNSPSGGIKEIVRSVSNRFKRTH